MGNRAQRLALNEATFRIANERMREWEERHVEQATELYMCECADPQCREHVPLDADAYEAVRTDSRHFFCLPGHEITDIEAVIERYPGYVVVEKAPEVAGLVTGTDPTRV